MRGNILLDERLAPARGRALSTRAGDGGLSGYGRCIVHRC